jgi:hypothetical protein
MSQKNIRLKVVYRLNKNKSFAKTQRKVERLAAEIQNLIKATHEWLGTFNTTEEVSKAYETKKLEFEAISC